MINECWLPIPGYEGFYEVSDLGRVRSLDRDVRSRLAQGRELKQGVRGKVPEKAYPRVTLFRGGRGVAKNVHSLVMLTFVGPRPEGWHTRHLNGNSHDARLVNLAYGTPKENYLDAIRHGTIPITGPVGKRRTTHCPKGHEYQPDRPSQAECRVCMTARMARWRKKKKLEAEQLNTDSQEPRP